MSKHPQMREWTSRHPFFSPCKSCKIKIKLYKGYLFKVQMCILL